MSKTFPSVCHKVVDDILGCTGLSPQVPGPQDNNESISLLHSTAAFHRNNLDGMLSGLLTESNPSQHSLPPYT
jgi:hypothetical protein